MHAPLQEIGTKHLPALQKVVSATNVAYRQYALEQIEEDARQADVWKEERKAVEDIAKSLRFE